MTGRSPYRSARIPLGNCETPYASHMPESARPIAVFETAYSAVMNGTTGLIASRAKYVTKNASIHSVNTVWRYRQFVGDTLTELRPVRGQPLRFRTDSGVRRDAGRHPFASRPSSGRLGGYETAAGSTRLPTQRSVATSPATASGTSQRNAASRPADAWIPATSNTVGPQQANPERSPRDTGGRARSGPDPARRRPAPGDDRDRERHSDEHRESEADSSSDGREKVSTGPTATSATGSY